ncbi:MAG: molybdopterin molybdotransferase MoeA, partial [Terriglobales bacterium]
PLPFADARRMVEEKARELRATTEEVVPLLDACGRVLAENIAADRDFPPFPRATRDGYAVRAADLATLPARLTVVADVRAGAGLPAGAAPVAAGQAVEIMTGAPVPAGAGAVVMVEYTTRTGSVVKITRGVMPGENVVAAGSEARTGDALLASGTRLSPAHIAVAAAVGRAELCVHKRPRVAVLATGDELVDVTARPGPSQIRNSNSYSLAAQVRAAGGEPVILPVAPDEKTALRRLLEQGLSSDLLLISGGVSVGKYDLVEQVLAEFDAEFFFTGALIQPGRPVVFGVARSPSSAPASFAAAGPAEDGRATPLFGLPGNPISTLVTFELFVRPVLDALSGAPPSPLIFPKARLRAEVKTKTGLTRFLPALLSGQHDVAEVELVRWQGSGDLAAASRANCYLVVPPDRELIPAGELVSVMVPSA